MAKKIAVSLMAMLGLSKARASGARSKESVFDKLSIAMNLRVVVVLTFFHPTDLQTLCTFIPNYANYSHSENQKKKDIQSFDIMPNDFEVLSYMVEQSEIGSDPYETG